MIRVALAGAGRMAQSIARVSAPIEDVSIHGVWSRSGAVEGFDEEITVSSDLAELANGADVIIDFSLPGATPTVAAAAREADTPLVCGVSGLGDDEIEALRRTSTSVGVVYDRNMSLGIALLGELLRICDAVLEPSTKVRIAETHHVHKKDSPSGTALALAELLGGRQVTFDVERRGEIPGDHEVEFVLPNEVLRLSHSVTTRDVFAEGALRAARWVTGAGAGWYSMRDVLATTLGR